MRGDDTVRIGAPKFGGRYSFMQLLNLEELEHV